MATPNDGQAPIDIADAYSRVHNIGDALMRKQRLKERCGFMAWDRLNRANALEAETGRREPHW